MFEHYYKHDLIRKYVVLVGTLFNTLQTVRVNKDDEVVQTIQVPVMYGPKQKWLVRLAQDPNLDKKVAMTVPFVGFEMTGMSYAGQRKLPSTVKNVYQVPGDTSRRRYQYTPVPYDFNFTVSIMAKNVNDGVQLVEQILPFFTPEFTANVKIMPEMDIQMDIPVVLNSVSIEDAYEGDYETRRVIIYNLELTVKGYLYGPVENAEVIKKAIATAFAQPTDATGNTGEKDFTYTVQPGLTAGGDATTSANNSVPLADIDADDPFGLIEEFTGFTN